ncbi:MAG: XRE family transcriptional regulator [Bacteroidales bacterium]|nr:XRE family transcriptional regulator [Bacteroidales bacterium]
MKMDKPNIGELICQRLKDEGRTKKWLADQVNCDPSNFCKTLKNKHIDTDLLLSISFALNYNFFISFADYIAEKQ